MAKGLILSALLKKPGAKRGRRIIDLDSLDLYLETLAKEQAEQRAAK